MMATNSTNIDEMTRSNSSAAQIPAAQAPEFALAVDQPETPSLASTLKFPEESPPLPTFNKPLQSLSLVELLRSTQIETLVPDAAKAKIKVAKDQSYIDTSSGPLARELKRHFDRYAGVGPTLRSPYVITACASKKGKPVYRLGFRDDAPPPGLKSASQPDKQSQAMSVDESSNSPQTKRRSRLSMHFTSPGMLSKSNALPPTGRPPTNPHAPRKLQRRTRSIPDLSSNALEDKGDKARSSAHTFATTGRGHSQSVTAVDIPRNPLLQLSQTDIPDDKEPFAKVMDWKALPIPQQSTVNGNLTADSRSTYKTVPQPFGPSVTFQEPAGDKSADDLKPKTIRPMQSFESGMTARQDDLSGEDTPELELELVHELTRPPSAIRLSQMSTISESSEPSTAEPLPPPEVDENISPESLQLSSHYSTEVFNVLQTYKGLPKLESFLPEEGADTTNVIRLSLTTETSAAPRDDPRFVLWGDFHPEQEAEDHRSTSRESMTDLSPSLASSTMSKRRSSKVSRMKSPESSHSRNSLPTPAAPIEPPQRVLLAATIERWLAQLTSDLNYDELLNFFLTYRAYVSPTDLCHLFICRFHWALQKPKSLEDQTVRRIVRVRTFVALRYWMVTFFTVDFTPNRELRLLISDWLNTLLHDPVLHKHMDGLGIVRRLIKVAKDCKKAHTKAGDRPKPTSPPRPTSKLPERGGDHLLGKSFANAVRREADEESDLDLDFLPDEANVETSVIGFPSDPANAHLSVHPSARPNSLPVTNMNILQRTDHAPGFHPDSDFRTQALPTPIRHNAISRAFGRTIGRLGRWKRALNQRTSLPKTPPPPMVSDGVGISAFDLEINASGDLLQSSGAVESYLKIPKPVSAPTATRPTSSSSSLNRTGPPVPSSPVPPVPALPPVVDTTTSRSLPQAPPSAPALSISVTAAAEVELPESPESPLAGHSASLPETTSSPALLLEDSPPPSSPHSSPSEFVDVDSSTTLEPILLLTTQASFIDEVEQLGSPERAESFRSSSSDSFGEPLTSNGSVPPSFPGTNWQFDVVSIDDLDFSDTSSFMEAADPVTPPGLPGLHKPARKLPMRRDFEFVRRSEVSSMGIISQESLRDSIDLTPDGPSPTSSFGAGPKPIHRWQMKSLQQTFEEMSNHSDDKGDVEAALRRLEGQINPTKVQENEEKVNGWVRNLQERLAKGDYEYSIYSEDEVEGFIDEVDSSPVDLRSASPDGPTGSGMDTDDEEFELNPHTPMPTQTEYQLPAPPGPEAPTLNDHKPPLDEVVPLEILQSRMDIASTDTLARSKLSTTTPPYFPDLDRLRIYRSFIFSYSAEQLAQHFSMIDRELFMTVKFEELIAAEWAESDEAQILDWAQYLKDRATWKVESRMAHKTTALAAVRTRFNLMVEFVVAEILLTAPAERLELVAKFIRIAWKCYQLSNFHTLTAIIYALDGEWVTIAMRRLWTRLPPFEDRILSDLTTFTKRDGDFKFMRQAVELIADAKHRDSSSRTPSIISGGTGDSQSGKIAPPLPACIPFIGIYLSQLARLNKLPALIDPTAPIKLVWIDPITAQFDPLARPEVFSSLQALPPSMQLEPLVNVHKQRCIAEVIKSLVAGQHMASRVQFSIDRKLFQKCLRLRGLERGRKCQLLGMKSPS